MSKINNNGNTYVATYRFYYLSSINIFFAVSLLIVGILEILFGGLIMSIILIMSSLIITYFVLFVYIKEMKFSDNSIEYRTILQTSNIKLSSIQDIKIYFTTKSQVMAGGKEKADMFVRLMLKGKPLSIIVFGRSLSNYKELYDRLIDKSQIR